MPPNIRGKNIEILYVNQVKTKILYIKKISYFKKKCVKIKKKTMKKCNKILKLKDQIESKKTIKKKNQ